MGAFECPKRVRKGKAVGLTVGKFVGSLGTSAPIPVQLGTALYESTTC